MSVKNLRKIKAKDLLRKPAGKFIAVDMEAFKHSSPKWMSRAFSNNRYVVMINDQAETTHGKAIRAMVQKHDDTPIINHWREMQSIKNEIFGEETTAVEYYPAESNLEDNHNIYWMWIFPNGVLPIPL
jgi:hypothetical protein